MRLLTDALEAHWCAVLFLYVSSPSGGLRASQLSCRNSFRECGRSLAESWPVAHRADALWYHAPNICENVRVERASAGQAVVVASMEPAGYYPCLDNPAFMGMFDLEMSYRMRVRITPCTSLLLRLLAAKAGRALVQNMSTLSIPAVQCTSVSCRNTLPCDMHVGTSCTVVPMHGEPGASSSCSVPGVLQSQVPVPYLREDQIAAWEGAQAPFEARANASAFVQSNCNVPSGRNVIVANLMAFTDVEVNSYGRYSGLLWRQLHAYRANVPGNCTSSHRPVLSS